MTEATQDIWGKLTAILKIVAPDKAPIISEIVWNYEIFEQLDGDGYTVNTQRIVTGATVQIDLG